MSEKTHISQFPLDPSPWSDQKNPRHLPRIPLRSPNLKDRIPGICLAILGLIAGLGWFVMDSKGVDFFQALGKTLEDLGKMFIQPELEHLYWEEALGGLGITLGLAFLTTLIGGIIAMILALMSAHNLGNEKLGNVIKALITLIRAIPTEVWVLIYAVSAGLGAVAAIIGMTFHTISYLVKAYAEAFEELDDGVLEALRASGATWLQVIFQAVFPSSMGLIISWTFMRFEINFGVAVAMGAAAGAGGIGFDLFMASSYYFNLREVGAIAWFILIVAVLMEVLANHLKARNRLGS